MHRMGAQTTPDARIARLAATQHGVVSRAQLYELGLGRRGIERRVASGRLHRLYRGVYAVGHTVVNRHGHYLAAVMACGDDAVLSHRSAAALWGIRPSDAPKIDVTVPRTSGVRSSRRVVVHRPARQAESTTRAGIRVTTPGQTLADLALGLPRRALEKAAENAEALRLHVAVAPAHPGTKRLAAAMGHDLTATTRSPLEDAFLELCAAYGIPRPLVNAVVEGHEVDFCWPDARLIVETDGYERHGTRAAFERDRARDADLGARGWQVARFTDRHVRRQAGWVAGAISARSPSPSIPG
jgi:hypothetical protein